MKKFCFAALFLCLATYTHASSTFYELLKQSWQLMNVDTAWSENPDITGQGIKIGILDGAFNTTHPSLQGKDIATFNNQFDFNKFFPPSDYGVARHGSHVAGIIIGAKLNDPTNPNLPNGIAYNGSYYGVAILNEQSYYNESVYEQLHDKDIKIINNSWGKNDEYFPMINRYFKWGYGYTSIDESSSNAPISADAYFALLERNGESEVLDLIRLSKQKGILNIIASGNDGSLSGGILSPAGAYDESIRSWLVVGALGTRSAKKDTTGQITLTQDVTSNSYVAGVASFSNLFKGSALYGIMATGVEIDSANALYHSTNTNIPEDERKWRFTESSGTSQATPMVSGAAMLVQQKFGFLSGAQIADVLLSTANDNVKLPKLIVQSYNGGALNNIVYINTDPPKTQDGKIDRTQVKQDLMGIGYDSAGADKILERLFKTQESVDTNTINDAEAVVRMESYEVIGQGVLDVSKALKGLGRLDANRLNLGDSVNLDGEIQAFYTLDTKGHSAEFSNNISQRLWDDKWHIAGALNSPEKELKDIKKVGLVKVGAGRLTLSGNNSYEGATRVLGGELELTSSGRLTKSNAYAENGGRFLLNGGTIANDAYARNQGKFLLSGGEITRNAYAENGGIFEITQSSRVMNAMQAQNNGMIILKENISSPVTLTTDSITLSNGGILAGSGIISNASNNVQIHNQSGEVRAGFVTIADFRSQASLELKGTYNQSDGGVLAIAFNGETNGNTQFVATTFNITGGALKFVPTYNGGERLKSGQSIKLNLGELNNHIDKFDSVTNKESNTLKFYYNSNTQSLEAAFKDNAFMSSTDNDAGLATALKHIAQSPNLPQSYNQYFGALDTLSPQNYQAGIDSLAENASLPNVEDTLNTQRQLSLDNILYLMDSENIAQPLYSASFTKPKPIRLALAQINKSDVILSDILTKLDNSHRNQMILNTNHTYFNHARYKSHTTALNLQYKRIYSTFLLGGFVDFAYSNANHTYAQRKTNRFSAGLSGIYDFKTLSLIALAHFGVGLNSTSHTLLTPSTSQNLNATKRNDVYNDYTLGLNLGVSKDFTLQSFKFKPMWLMSYTSVFQDPYTQSGGIFAKSFSGSIHNTLGSSLGLHINYVKEFERVTLLVGGFGFYNVRFLKHLEQNVTFNDFRDFGFTQSFETNVSSVYSGLHVQVRYEEYFGRIGFSNEVGRNYMWINTNLTLGVNF
ncbi:S8 family serine peptidase [Helicobacter himalayensis]|uniref:autotransporter serine protease n=1 Tax=Helicobacter himalayensis TaxID=1591088 RepID=UPI003D6EEF63